MNLNKIKEDFPITNKLVYMDSSCVSLKPRQVIGAINRYYEEFPACAGRSSHRLGLKVTEEVKKARKNIAKFFGAKEEEIIFTRNTSEGINLISRSLGLKEGDKVLISDKEHNSNLIPWQNLRKKGIHLEIYKFNDLDDFERKIEGTTLVSTVQTSNLDGTTQNIKEIAKITHKHGAKILIDGAQSAPHKEVDVKQIDFFVCSGHKMLGPSGTGILYGKKELLEELEPFLVGGETVKESWYDRHEIEDLPERFEAGLQNYAGIMGLSAAIDYLRKVGLKNIHKHEAKLNKIITENIQDEVKILGEGDRGGIISFTADKVDPHDIALQLDSQAKILTRSGYHCCHSWFNANNIKGSARASLYLYNTEEEAEQFSETLKNALKILR